MSLDFSLSEAEAQEYAMRTTMLTTLGHSIRAQPDVGPTSSFAQSGPKKHPTVTSVYGDKPPYRRDPGLMSSIAIACNVFTEKSRSFAVATACYQVKGRQKLVLFVAGRGTVNAKVTHYIHCVWIKMIEIARFVRRAQEPQQDKKQRKKERHRLEHELEDMILVRNFEHVINMLHSRISDFNYGSPLLHEVPEKILDHKNVKAYIKAIREADEKYWPYDDCLDEDFMTTNVESSLETGRGIHGRWQQWCEMFRLIDGLEHEIPEDIRQRIRGWRFTPKVGESEADEAARYRRWRRFQTFFVKPVMLGSAIRNLLGLTRQRRQLLLNQDGSVKTFHVKVLPPLQVQRLPATLEKWRIRFDDMNINGAGLKDEDIYRQHFAEKVYCAIADVDNWLSEDLDTHPELKILMHKQHRNVCFSPNEIGTSKPCCNHCALAFFCCQLERHKNTRHRAPHKGWTSAPLRYVTEEERVHSAFHIRPPDVRIIYRRTLEEFKNVWANELMKECPRAFSEYPDGDLFGSLFVPSLDEGPGERMRQTMNEMMMEHAEKGRS